MKLKNLLLVLVFILVSCTQKTPPKFDGQSALAYAQSQIDFGARTPGSDAHEIFISWAEKTLKENEWSTEIQETQYQGQNIKNIIAKRENAKNSEWILLGAHYDSRFFADQDPDPTNRTLPVPGANDGASGIAVLLELSRVLPQKLDKNIWLVFFDAEDQGRIDGWDWILGSRAFVESLENYPDQVVIVDMIGDADLNIYLEGNSDSELQTEIWDVADNLGYGEKFISEYKYSMLDDHTPFHEKGIQAIDIIDFDYPYWHTTEDTIDKISADSLEAVGNTVLQWIIVP